MISEVHINIKWDQVSLHFMPLFRPQFIMKNILCLIRQGKKCNFRTDLLKENMFTSVGYGAPPRINRAWFQQADGFNHGLERASSLWK